MRHRDVRLIPIADWSKGTNQAPGFMSRARGAASEMENLVVDLDGRPIPRDGYTPIDTRTESIGTIDGQYKSGDQLVVVHWLGEDNTPEGIKRIYYFPRDADWVQDERGRLLFFVIPGQKPRFIDIKRNTVFDWDLTPPPSPPILTIDRTAIEAAELDEDDPATIYKKISDIGIYPNPFIGEGNIIVDVAETVTFTVSIYNIEGKRIRDLNGIEIDDRTGSPSQGRQIIGDTYEPGRYNFKWDGRTDLGEEVALSDFYSPSIKDENGNVIRIERASIVGHEKLPGLTERETIERFTGRIEDTAHDDGELKEGTGFRSGTYVLCYTFASNEFAMETRPSPISQIYVYSFSNINARKDDNESLSRALVNISVECYVDNMPDWADRVRVYAKRGRVLPGTTEAVETGFDFVSVGSQIREVLSDRVDPHFTWVNERREFPSFLLDSYDHDGPPDGINSLGAYGVGLWAAAGNRVFFNKIGNLGEQRIYTMPQKNALVPHSFPLPRSGQSPILHIHPAAHESALLAFKRDAIHIIRGKGVISGLYDPNTPVNVDVDASGVIEGTGTASPRSVLTVGSGVYFVGSDRRFYRYGADWRGNSDLKDVGMPIQKYLNELRDDELDKLVAFLYQNCYHLITPRRVIVLDMTLRYWTSFNWELKDAFWSRGGVDSESILYGLTTDNALPGGNELVRLYHGDTDNRIAINCMWESNPLAMPSESLITGVMLVHTSKPSPLVKCRVDVDDVKGKVRGFIPSAANRFRCGTHQKGSRVSVRVECDVSFPRLDRVQAEVYPKR